MSVTPDASDDLTVRTTDIGCRLRHCKRVHSH